MTPPIEYRDGAAVIAFFLGHAEAARATTVTRLGEVVRLGPRAVLTLACFEHRDTTIGPYNAVWVAAHVHDPWRTRPIGVWADLLKPAGRRRSGMYPIDLPMTTSEADAATNELFGQPQLLTPIGFQLRGSRVCVTVEDPRGATWIMRLAGDLGPAIPVGKWDMVFHSPGGRSIVRTNMCVRAHARAHVMPRATLLVGRTDHPMAKRLRLLGLAGARPVLCLTIPGYRARLHTSAVVG